MKLLLNSKLVNFYLIVNFSVILILSHIKFLINIAKYIFDIEIFCISYDINCYKYNFSRNLSIIKR